MSSESLWKMMDFKNVLYQINMVILSLSSSPALLCLVPHSLRVFTHAMPVPGTVCLSLPPTQNLSDPSLNYSINAKALKISRYKSPALHSIHHIVVV